MIKCAKQDLTPKHSNIEGKDEQKALMQRSGQLIAEILDDDLAATDSETSIELLLQY